MLVWRLALAASAAALAACGITGNFRHDPGYVDFGPLIRLEAGNDISLSFGPLPLKLAGLFLDEEDEAELGPLLHELRGVRVYTLEGVADAAKLVTGVDELTAELARSGWLSIVQVDEGSEVTSVWLRLGSGQDNRGLAVIVREPSELVVVNLIGNVRLDFFDGYMSELDLKVPPIDLEAAVAQASSVSAPAVPASETGP